MRFSLPTVAAIICAASPVVAQVQPGDVIDYEFQSVPFNSLGVNNISDFRGKPVFVEFWGTR